MEKSLKNLISALGEKPTRWLPNPPPTPLHRESAEFTLWKERDSRTRTRIWDTEKGGGEGRKNTAKLNNSSTEQHFDAIFHMKIVIPFLLLIALTKCAYLLLASLASKNGVLYSEGRAYKREPELAASPQLTALGTFNRQHLCEERCIKNEVGHSNTRGTVSSLFFLTQNNCCT